MRLLFVPLPLHEMNYFDLSASVNFWTSLMKICAEVNIIWDHFKHRYINFGYILASGYGICSPKMFIVINNYIQGIKF
jgi:hypothetical protein